MFSSRLIVLIPLLLASYVSAHGYLAAVTIGNDNDRGNPPFGGAVRDSAIRQVTSPNPNEGTNNPALTCGPGARRAKNIINAMPGDNMSFDWKGADGSNWPHNTGPMITYLASCGDTPCNEFDASNARWFKIDEKGYKNRGSLTWFQQDLMNGARATSKLPDNLAPGNYLVRHEIIALHLAAQGRAEFYPACVQIRVGGDRSGRPRQEDTVRFPGGYRDNDAGIRLNPFSTPNYPMPGPRVAALVDGGNSGNGNNGGNNNGNGGNPPATSSTRANPAPPKSSTVKSTPTSTKSNPKPSPTSNNGSQNSPKPKVCRLRNGAKSTKVPRSLPTGAAALYPRHFSRVMRRIVEGNGFEARAAAAAST